MGLNLLNNLVQGRRNDKPFTTMEQVGKLAAIQQSYNDSWKRYVNVVPPGGPIRTGNVRGSSINTVEDNQEYNMMKNFQYMMLCNKIGIGVKELCNKQLNDEAASWKMKMINEQRAAKKAEISKKKRK